MSPITTGEEPCGCAEHVGKTMVNEVSLFYNTIPMSLYVAGCSALYPSLAPSLPSFIGVQFRCGDNISAAVHRLRIHEKLLQDEEDHQ